MGGRKERDPKVKRKPGALCQSNPISRIQHLMDLVTALKDKIEMCQRNAIPCSEVRGKPSIFKITHKFHPKLHMLRVCLNPLPRHVAGALHTLLT